MYTREVGLYIEFRARHERYMCLDEIAKVKDIDGSPFDRGSHDSPVGSPLKSQ